MPGNVAGQGPDSDSPDSLPITAWMRGIPHRAPLIAYRPISISILGMHADEGLPLCSWWFYGCGMFLAVPGGCGVRV